MQIHDTFEAGVDPRWQIHTTGNGAAVRRHGSLHLTLAPDDEPGRYSSVQLTEYAPDKRDFQFKPPVRMKVRAYSSLHPSEMRGSAGFGFWNHPLDFAQPDLGQPLGLGFTFASPVRNLNPAMHIATHGLKVMSMDVENWQFTPLIPLQSSGMTIIRNPMLQRILSKGPGKTASLSECTLDQNLLTAEHEYSLDWRLDGAIFRVDNQVVHEIHRTPQHALGFVARIDNQNSVITKQGEVILGRVSVKRPQALVITEICIEPLPF